MQEESTTEQDEEPGTEAAEDTGTDSASDEEKHEDDEKSDIEKEKEAARAEVEALEDDPPKDLSDWPTGKAKYETLGGADSESGYEDGATANLGPSDVRHYEDGTVTVAGEKVDNPEDYKGEPIPGGPTDPNTPATSGEQDLSEKSSTVDSGDDESDDSGDQEQKEEGS